MYKDENVGITRKTKFFVEDASEVDSEEKDVIEFNPLKLK